MAIVVHLCKRSVSPEPEGADGSIVNLALALPYAHSNSSRYSGSWVQIG